MTDDVPQCRKANKAALAAFFDVSLPTIDSWVRRGCPVLQEGSQGTPWIFDLLAVADWRAERKPALPNDLNSMSPRERLDFVRAERERLRLEADQGQLIPAAEVERVLSEAFKALALALSTLPDALERGCGLPPDAVARAQHLIDDARESLYASLTAVTHG